ncbi:MAG: hypothetical protein Q8P67_03845 [archaeon]|nr:hypothetical protein [archaeon]
MTSLEGAKIISFLKSNKKIKIRRKKEKQRTEREEGHTLRTVVQKPGCLCISSRALAALFLWCSSVSQLAMNNN